MRKEYPAAIDSEHVASPPCHCYDSGSGAGREGNVESEGIEDQPNEIDMG